MTWKVLYEGPGFCIARNDDAKTLVPYPPADRDGGHFNHGFVLLADQPELAEAIHEAQRSPGLMALLKEVNRVGSHFLTIGCECGVFKRPPGSDPDRYIGSYIAICFRDPALNSADHIYELARQVIRRTPGSAEHNIAFEITVFRLRSFFGHDGCYELHVNAVGNGNSDDAAWAAFSFACHALAEAFNIIYELPASDPLFAPVAARDDDPHASDPGAS